jgi:DNA-binding transcriptional ArsR family regulator
MTDDEQALDRTMRALADPTRRRIHALLSQQPGLTTGQLSARVPGMSRWGVMKHLARLREAGLVQTFPEGRRRRHYIEPEALSVLQRWVEAGSPAR